MASAASRDGGGGGGTKGEACGGASDGEEIAGYDALRGSTARRKRARAVSRRAKQGNEAAKNATAARSHAGGEKMGRHANRQHVSKTIKYHHGNSQQPPTAAAAAAHSASRRVHADEAEVSSSDEQPRLSQSVQGSLERLHAGRSLFVYDFDKVVPSGKFLLLQGKFDVIVISHLSIPVSWKQHTDVDSLVLIRASFDVLINDVGVLTKLAERFLVQGAAGFVVDFPKLSSLRDRRRVSRRFHACASNSTAAWIVANPLDLFDGEHTAVRPENFDAIALVTSCWGGCFLENAIDLLSNCFIRAREEATRRRGLLECMEAIRISQQKSQNHFVFMVREFAQDRIDPSCAGRMTFYDRKPSLSALHHISAFCVENNALGCISIPEHRALKGLFLSYHLLAVPSPTAMLLALSIWFRRCRSANNLALSSDRSVSNDEVELALQRNSPGKLHRQSEQSLWKTWLPSLVKQVLNDRNTSARTSDDITRLIFKVLVTVFHSYSKHHANKRAFSKKYSKLALVFHTMATAVLSHDRKVIDESVGGSMRPSFAALRKVTLIRAEELHESVSYEDSTSQTDNGWFDFDLRGISDEFSQHELFVRICELEKHDLLQAVPCRTVESSLIETIACLEREQHHSCECCEHRAGLLAAVGLRLLEDLRELVKILPRMSMKDKAHNLQHSKRRISASTLEPVTAEIWQVKKASFSCLADQSIDHSDVFSMATTELRQDSALVLKIFVREDVSAFTPEIAFFHFMLFKGRNEQWARLAQSVFGSVAHGSLVPNRFMHEISTMSVDGLLGLLQTPPWQTLNITWKRNEAGARAFAILRKSVLLLCSERLMLVPLVQNNRATVFRKIMKSHSVLSPEFAAFTMALSHDDINSVLLPLGRLLEDVVAHVGLTPSMTVLLQAVDSHLRIEALREISLRLRPRAVYFDDSWALSSAAHIEMLGCSPLNCQDAFGMNFFDLASMISAQLKREFNKDAWIMSEKSALSSPTSLRPSKTARALFADQLLFAFPLLLNIVLLLTLGVSQFGSRDMRSEDRTTLSAGIVLGFLCSGLWNNTIARLLGLPQFVSSFHAQVVVASRLGGAMLTIALVITTGFMLTAFWISVASSLLLSTSAGLVFLMNVFLALVVNMAPIARSRWHSVVSIVIVASQAANLAFLLGIKFFTSTILQGWMFVVGIAIANLVLLAGFGLVSFLRMQSSFKRRNACTISDDDIREWYSRSRNILSPVQSGDGLEQSVQAVEFDSIARQEFYAEITARLLNRWRGHSCFSLPHKNDLVGAKIGRYDFERELLSWYRTHSSEQVFEVNRCLPKFPSVEWDLELTRATEAWTMSEQTSFVTRGGVLHMITRWDGAVGLLYHASLFHFIILTLLWIVTTKDSAEIFAVIPGSDRDSDNPASIASLWALVFMMFVSGGLEPVVRARAQRWAVSPESSQTANRKGQANLVTSNLTDYMLYFQRDGFRMFLKYLGWIVPGAVLGFAFCLVGALLSSTSFDDVLEPLIIFCLAYLGLALVLYTLIHIERSRLPFAVWSGTFAFLASGSTCFAVAVLSKSSYWLRFAPLFCNWSWALAVVIDFVSGSDPQPELVPHLALSASGQRSISSQREATAEEFRVLQDALQIECCQYSGIAVTPSSTIGRALIVYLRSASPLVQISSSFSGLLETVADAFSNNSLEIFLVTDSLLTHVDFGKGGWSYAAVADQSATQLRVFVGVPAPRHEIKDFPSSLLIRIIAEAIVHEFWETKSSSHHEAVLAECLLSTHPRQLQVPRRIVAEIHRLARPDLIRLIARRMPLMADYVGIDLTQWQLFSYGERLAIIKLHSHWNSLAKANEGQFGGRNVLRHLIKLCKMDARGTTRAVCLASAAVSLRRLVRKQLLHALSKGPTRFVPPKVSDINRHNISPDADDLGRSISFNSKFLFNALTFDRLAFLSLLGDSEFDLEAAHVLQFTAIEGGLFRALRPSLWLLRRIHRWHCYFVALFLRFLWFVHVRRSYAKHFWIDEEITATICRATTRPISMTVPADDVSALFEYRSQRSLVPFRICIKRISSSRPSHGRSVGRVYLDKGGTAIRMVLNPEDNTNARTIFFNHDRTASRYRGILRTPPRETSAEVITFDDYSREHTTKVIKFLEQTQVTFSVRYEYIAGSLNVALSEFSNFEGCAEFLPQNLLKLGVHWSVTSPVEVRPKKVVATLDGGRQIMTFFNYTITDRPAKFSSLEVLTTGEVIQATTPVFMLDDPLGIIFQPPANIRWNWYNLWTDRLRHSVPVPDRVKAHFIRHIDHCLPTKDSKVEPAPSCAIDVHCSLSVPGASRFTSLQRQLLWNAWSIGNVPGPFVEVLDSQLVRAEPSLKKYFYERHKGRYARAAAVLIRHSLEVDAEISVDDLALRVHPLRVLGVADLALFTPAGAAVIKLEAVAMNSTSNEIQQASFNSHRHFFDAPVRSSTPELVESSPPSHSAPNVIFLDSGTWPAESGGVSNARRDLLLGLHAEFAWRAVSEIASPHRVRKFSLGMVSWSEYIPLGEADLDGPNEWILNDVPFALLAWRKQATTESVVRQQFLPLLRVLVDACMSSLPVDMSELCGRLYLYFQRYDWTETWHAPSLRYHWRLWVGQKTLDRGKPLPVPVEADMALVELSRHFLAFVRPLSEYATVFHVSHHGPQALLSVAAKFLFRSSIVVWDHGIFAKERAFALSHAEYLPLFVRTSLMSFFVSVAYTLYMHADIVSPCSTVNNDDWERFLASPATSGSVLARPAATFSRKISPVENGSPAGVFLPSRIKKEGHPLSIVLMLSHVMPLKDIENAIVAARILLDTISPEQAHSYRLLICGSLDRDVEYSRTCAQLILRLGLQQHVKLLGEQDARKMLAQATLFLNSSKSEALPLAVVEAALCGITAVCTDVGGTRTIVGEYGKLVPPQNPGALARAQNELLFGLESKRLLARGRRWREYVAERFSLESFLRGHAQLLRTAESLCLLRRIHAAENGGTSDQPVLVRSLQVYNTYLVNLRPESFSEAYSRSSDSSEDYEVVSRESTRPC